MGFRSRSARQTVEKADWRVVTRRRRLTTFCPDLVQVLLDGRGFGRKCNRQPLLQLIEVHSRPLHAPIVHTATQSAMEPCGAHALTPPQVGPGISVGFRLRSVRQTAEKAYWRVFTRRAGSQVDGVCGADDQIGIGDRHRQHRVGDQLPDDDDCVELADVRRQVTETHSIEFKRRSSQDLLYEMLGTWSLLCRSRNAVQRRPRFRPRVRRRLRAPRAR